MQTQFGWHVIKLEETRDLAPPPFDNVKQRVEEMVQQKKIKTYLDGLMTTAKVEKKLDAAAPAAPRHHTGCSGCRSFRARPCRFRASCGKEAVGLRSARLIAAATPRSSGCATARDRACTHCDHVCARRTSGSCWRARRATFTQGKLDLEGEDLAIAAYRRPVLRNLEASALQILLRDGRQFREVAVGLFEVAHAALLVHSETDNRSPPCRPFRFATAEYSRGTYCPIHRMRGRLPSGCFASSIVKGRTGWWNLIDFSMPSACG